MRSYPGQHTLSHVARQKSENLQHKNTHSCPLCSCTPEDMCQILHIHLYLQEKQQNEQKGNKHGLIVEKKFWR